MTVLTEKDKQFLEYLLTGFDTYSRQGRGIPGVMHKVLVEGMRDDFPTHAHMKGYTSGWDYKVSKKRMRELLGEPDAGYYTKAAVEMVLTEQSITEE